MPWACCILGPCARGSRTLHNPGRRHPGCQGNGAETGLGQGHVAEELAAATNGGGELLTAETSLPYALRFSFAKTPERWLSRAEVSPPNLGM